MTNRKIVLSLKLKRRLSGEKKLEKRLMTVLTLVKKGYSNEKIGTALNSSKPIRRTQICKYKKELIKRGHLERDERNGRVIVPKSSLKIRKYEQMLKEPFMQIPEIRKVWDSMQSTNKGKGLTNMGSTPSKILTVCNTLDVYPSDLLQGYYYYETELEKNPNAEPDHLVSLTYAMLEFQRHMENGTIKYNQDMKFKKSDDEPSILGYVLAMRSLYASNGKPVPRSYGGKGHILSGAKENYGAYNYIQLSDKAKLRGMEWFKAKYGVEYARFFAFMFEMMPRPKSLYKWYPSFEFESKTIDGHVCNYASARIYESKTHKKWTKSIYDPIVVEMARQTPIGEPLISEPYSIFEKKFAFAMREFLITEKWLSESVLLSRKDPKYPKYKKTTTEYYLNRYPIYVLRHSGAHMWMRRTNYSANIVARMGWETVDVLTKAYAEMPNGYELEAGTCYYCDPPESGFTDNLLFCSQRHALVYLQNGNIQKNMIKHSIA